MLELFPGRDHPEHRNVAFLLFAFYDILCTVTHIFRATAAAAAATHGLTTVGTDVVVTHKRKGGRSSEGAANGGDAGKGSFLQEEIIVLCTHFIIL